jgi:hypothetical protein
MNKLFSIKFINIIRIIKRKNINKSNYKYAFNQSTIPKAILSKLLLSIVFIKGCKIITGA